MNATTHLLLGLGLLSLGTAFLTVLSGVDLPVFAPRPLGVVLVIVGIVDLAEGGHKALRR